MSYDNFSVAMFSIFRSHCDLVPPDKVLAKSIFTKPRKVIFPILGILGHDFCYFAKLPHSGVNISGKGRDAPVKFLPLIKPSGHI